MLRLEGVCAAYGPVKVLHTVDITVPRNSTVALLGANGAGKTTLLKVASGLLKATAGHVLFQGQPVGSLPPHRRARAGLMHIMEGRSIFRRLTVRENLAMWVSRREFDGAWEQVIRVFPGLAERLDQPAGTMSGGQQQMLAVSRALVGEPQLLLVDEVSVGLAPNIIDEVYRAIEELRSKGTGILLVEQYLDRALELADFVYVLHKGRVAWVGEANQCRAQHVFERYLGSEVSAV